jgi:hemolysin III
MKRTKLKDRILPKYTKGEEIFNMVTHICGGALGIVAVVLLPIFATIHHNPCGVISGVIFGISMIVLYTMSSIYHGLSPNLKAKKVFQIFDHCAIFLLIAGSYTPFCLCTLMKYSSKFAWTIFSIIWALAIIGIIFNSIDIKKYKILSMICYLLMGWCIIVKASILPPLLTPVGFGLLLGGGIIYSIGAILYGLGKKLKYIHSIFHIFIFLGSLLHFLCVLLYVV